MLATTSRRAALAPTMVRQAASSWAGDQKAKGNPHDAAPTDSRLDVLREVLYPGNSAAPGSASPVGARHGNHLARIEAVLPSHEAHETIERAYQLLRRRETEARKRALEAKFASLTAACDELDAVTKAGGVNRQVYDSAMVRISQASAAYAAAAQGIAQGKRKTAESVFIENRVPGLIPREAWVPTETRGKAWNYEWERPSNA
ncbi:uncharacterized protein LOC62_03G004157 [Vanrija pseudolonga]|uniref:Uncharacterized protein n=1 Tax=Vanrija pseudolonga TaxID=143232 RepID=A0AAF0Y614_9TREE|nr:hypothetical protein LOC62_03G004157 [Vanrija pseudolonga]